MRHPKVLFTILLSLVLSTGWGQQLSKTFTWNGFKMNYPSNYIITDKEYDPEVGYSFVCEIDDDESLSMITVVFDDLGEFIDESTTAVKQEGCIEGLEEGLSAMREALSNSTFKSTPIMKNTSLSYPNAYCDFSYTMFGIQVQGKGVMYFKGKYLIMYFIQAENSTYIKELESIAKTIQINKGLEKIHLH